MARLRSSQIASHITFWVLSGPWSSFGHRGLDRSTNPNLIAQYWRLSLRGTKQRLLFMFPFRNASSNANVVLQKTDVFYESDGFALATPFSSLWCHHALDILSKKTIEKDNSHYRFRWIWIEWLCLKHLQRRPLQ